VLLNAITAYAGDSGVPPSGRNHSSIVLSKPSTPKSIKSCRPSTSPTIATAARVADGLVVDLRVDDEQDRALEQHVLFDLRSFRVGEGRPRRVITPSPPL
jgi:hypothetical protein